MSSDSDGCGCLLILALIACLFAGCFGFSIDVDGKRHNVGCSCNGCGAVK